MNVAESPSPLPLIARERHLARVVAVVLAPISGYVLATTWILRMLSTADALHDAGLGAALGWPDAAIARAVILPTLFAAALGLMAARPMEFVIDRYVLGPVRCVLAVNALLIVSVFTLSQDDPVRRSALLSLALALGLAAMFAVFPDDQRHDLDLAFVANGEARLEFRVATGHGWILSADRISVWAPRKAA